MNDDGWGHEYAGKTGPYKEYELSKQERNNLSMMASRLSDGYSDEDLLRKHINYVEDLQKEISDILTKEQEIGYSNVTLKHDYKRLTSLLSRLEEELDRIDPKGF